MGSITILDGPMGTELERRGVPTPLPAWTAAALLDAPAAVSAIHRDYAAAGAEVHTANTFRTRPRSLAGGPLADRWRELVDRAVSLCREAIGAGARVAGSLAPLEDCFRPDLTPDDDALDAEHGELARALAAAGCDLILVETMPTRRELRAATAAAAATGLPVWAAITLGPRGDFYAPGEAAAARREAGEAGASVFLINCTPADRITPLLASLADGDGPTLGAYGNDLFEGGRGWSPERYADEAAAWAASGAGVVGGCCGTGPRHITALVARLAPGRAERA